MKAAHSMVVDTMVFAYSLLRVADFCDTATQVFEQLPEVWVPDSFHAELANVAWQWIRTKNVSIDVGLQALKDARALTTDSIPTPTIWERALELAVERSHPVYDTLFVALAILRASRVITFDKKLLDKFPEYTISPTDWLQTNGKTQPIAPAPETTDQADNRNPELPRHSVEE